MTTPTLSIGGVPITTVGEITYTPKSVSTLAMCLGRGRYQATFFLSCKKLREYVAAGRGPFEGRSGEAYRRRKAWRAQRGGHRG